MSTYDEHIRCPYENDKDEGEDLTIGDLLALNLPSNYKIKFDGFCGGCRKGELLVDQKDEEISVNG